MKFYSPTIILFSGILAMLASACQNETPTIGSGLASGEVHITLDSLTWNGTQQWIYHGEDSTLYTCQKLERQTDFDISIDSRSTTNLIGRLSVPEYGDLNCSFVSRLMCAKTLSIPDSIPIEQVDSMSLILSVPRGELTGDSLAPQQLRVFRLTKSLPIDITNTFDPTGYYNPDEPLGSKSYTLSALGMKDSIYQKLSYINVEIPMTQDMARETVKAYRNNPETFQWPQSFEKYFHGIYVEPSFGRGCVANIVATNFVIFYNYDTMQTVTTTDTTYTENVNKAVAVGVFESSPIVLSSNNITYKPSDHLRQLADEGQSIITAPGGYRVKIKFPGQELVDIYNRTQSRLAVVANLAFNIPAEDIDNDYGLTPPPYLLMVKSSKLEEFLANNSLPDNKESFYATYDATKKRYAFSSMRSYIVDLIENGVKEEDLDFTIIPVNLTLESNSSSSSSYYYGYGYSSGSTSYSVTKCTPYIAKPAMCRLLIDKAQTVFTFSTQIME